MFSERKPKKEQKAQKGKRKLVNHSAARHQFNPHLMHQSVQGGQIRLLGKGTAELHTAAQSPNLLPLFHMAHCSLLVNEVTSLLPGIAVRKGISHRHTMLTNNLHHGHLWKVPDLCGHTPASTLSRNVHARCWQQHMPGLPLRAMTEENLLSRFQAKTPESVRRILPQSHQVVGNSCLCPKP